MTAQLSSMEAARLAVKALVWGGVRDVVVAPGSRSAPLAYALAEAETRDELRLHVRIDERGAAFTALGLSLGSLRPVPVVTTSGTAVGELLPAVMEANHAGVELLVISADRPEEMRGTGANQTTVQPGLFGIHVRSAVDIPAGDDPTDAIRTSLLNAKGIPLPPALDDLRAMAATPSPGQSTASPDLGPHHGTVGPVHINLPFRDPLFPGPEPVLAAKESGRQEGIVPTAMDGREPDWAIDWPVSLAEPAVHATDEHRTVVVAGHGAGAVAEAFARAHRLPLLAEPSSNARFGPNAIGPYRMLLSRFGTLAERVVVFGRPTLSRPVAALLAREDVQTALYQPEPVAWFEPGRRRERVISEPEDLSLFAGSGPDGWLQLWRQAGGAADVALIQVLDAEPGLTGLRVGRSVWLNTRGRLVLGSSNPIRDVDLAGTPIDTPDAFVHANRGLAGIDGTVATSSGIALGAGTATRALMGDLTFLHDAGSLLLGPGEPEPDLQIVVVNDSGGGIFSTLEHGKVGEQASYASAVERLFGTPHRADLASLAAGYGVQHRQVKDTDELDAVLSEPVTGRSMVEVRTDRSRLRSLHAEVAAAIATATSGLLD
ncbi:2-succinyl-5-enolpyruvyl-6-hydroxy-3-cyclohexene-1-carboxylate synthase [Arthrobacter sp. CAU 1506]|uniref:2-succinyl-5-enolpyruvyl-6-hydroxy-3- cyclohexene-1-carboxylate synthase n=1 Tax=Arthrobacter sp. CAU 1506 TaxID=2560052 RepID=UPI0010ABA3C2|nr:thiamine pyrophosphate-binding protein [Arthrobacter sp. CAU 1506]TJY64089.1 2-succinyl-5-enolpyruvyl-6-hydroxy-3-cyclohexene-1-carboxylate synthase [Arthrobacter sp. CAU 1506]